jgi:hypothetical protein
LTEYLTLLLDDTRSTDLLISSPGPPIRDVRQAGASMPGEKAPGMLT